MLLVYLVLSLYMVPYYWGQKQWFFCTAICTQGYWLTSCFVTRSESVSAPCPSVCSKAGAVHGCHNVHPARLSSEGTHDGEFFHPAALSPLLLSALLRANALGTNPMEKKEKKRPHCRQNRNGLWFTKSMNNDSVSMREYGYRLHKYSPSIYFFHV